MTTGATAPAMRLEIRAVAIQLSRSTTPTIFPQTPTEFTGVTSRNDARILMVVRVMSEMDMWRWGALHCVLIYHEQPHGLVIQVRRQSRVLAQWPCADPDCAALEAERLYQVVSGEPIDAKLLPQWLRKFRGIKEDASTVPVTRQRRGTR